VQGDESGAITSACETVEAATNALYDKHNLGDTKTSYQAKVNTVLQRLKIIDRLKKELTELPIKNEDADPAEPNALTHSCRRLGNPAVLPSQIACQQPCRARIVWSQ
jgi:hypothetical protein